MPVTDGVEFHVSRLQSGEGGECWICRNDRNRIHFSFVLACQVFFARELRALRDSTATTVEADLTLRNCKD